MNLIDMVSWEAGSDSSDLDHPSTGSPDPDPLFAWKYRSKGKKDSGLNLSTFTQLVVRESQEAVLFGKGRLLGKFGPGKHTLNTENLPLLKSLYGIPFGGKNPFLAEVWFVNKLVPLNIDWTTSSMMYQDPDYQTMVPLRACGRYGLKVQDAERFLIKLVGTATDFRASSLTNHFRGVLESKTKTALLSYMQSQHIGLKSISAYLEPLSAALQNPMLVFWEDYGFHLEGFYITSIEVDGSDPAGQRILEAIGRQSAQVIGGYSWQQSRAFEVADNALDSMATNGHGMLGALVMTGMMGGAGGIGNSLLQPNPGGVPASGVSGQVGQGAQMPPREVFCSNCTTKYSSTAKFCPKCGDPYTPCPRCGADNDQNARRCVSCGASLGAARNCAHCNSPLPPDVNVCPRCFRPANSTQTCKACKSPLAAGDAFCSNCGNKVE